MRWSFLPRVLSTEMTHMPFAIHLQVTPLSVYTPFLLEFRRLSETSRFDDDLAFPSALTCSERQVLHFLIIGLSLSISHSVSQSVSQSISQLVRWWGVVPTSAIRSDLSHFRRKQHHCLWTEKEWMTVRNWDFPCWGDLSVFSKIP